jgi:hypothetical protein
LTAAVQAGTWRGLTGPRNQQDPFLAARLLARPTAQLPALELKQRGSGDADFQGTRQLASKRSFACELVADAAIFWYFWSRQCRNLKDIWCCLSRSSHFHLRHTSRAAGHGAVTTIYANRFSLKQSECREAVGVTGVTCLSSRYGKYRLPQSLREHQLSGEGYVANEVLADVRIASHAGILAQARRDLQSGGTQASPDRK